VDLLRRSLIMTRLGITVSGFVASGRTGLTFRRPRRDSDEFNSCENPVELVCFGKLQARHSGAISVRCQEVPIMRHLTAASPITKSPVEITLFFTAFVAVTYGFGIYLFAALVPDMRQSLGFGYGTVGLATGIAQAGFLAASLLSGLLAPVFGASRLIFGSLILTGTGLLLMSRLTGAGEMTVLLTLMGAAAASVWVPMVGVCQEVIPARHHGKALGLMSSGTSYGVFINGLIAPPLLATHGWPSAWFTTGILTALLLLAAFWRLGSLDQMKHGNGTVPDTRQSATSPLRSRLGVVLRPLGLLMITTMFLNGLSCMPFQTYLVPLLREDFGWQAGDATHLWSLIGGIGMVGGFALGWLADRISIKWAMLVTYLLLSLAAAIPLVLSHATPAAASRLMQLAGISFGLAFYAIFGLVPAYISAWFKGDAATLLFGIGNIALGLGGLLGNLGGGYAKSLLGSFAPVYAFVLAAALLQVVLALVTPNERRQVLLAEPAPVASPSCG
jgi:predicted MFS family arabinose efflux permease